MKNKFFIAATALTVAFAFTSCGSDDDGAAPLPPIGGYDKADDVGKANLLAYWPLDGDGTESISNTDPASAVGATWVEGIKGDAVNLNAGYLTYPSIAALTQTMNAFTISAWVNVKNNQETTASVSTIFSLTRPNEWEGNINLYAETGHFPNMSEGVVNDTIKLKAGFRSTASGGELYETFHKLEPWMVEDNLITPGKHVANANKVAGTWAHVVFTWDGATNKLIIYSNGAKISSPAFEVRGTNTTLVMDTPTMPIIGAFGNVATTTDVWNKPMKGMVDEVRVFNKALIAADINALYQLEKAGR